MKGKSKYNAVKTVVDGQTFHSKKEAKRYQELRLFEKAGMISGLETQVKYALEVNGEKIGSYIADFVYEEKVNGKWTTIVEDCKGYRTAIYKWKKRHFEEQYHVKIKET